MPRLQSNRRISCLKWRLEGYRLVRVLQFSELDFQVQALESRAYCILTFKRAQKATFIEGKTFGQFAHLVNYP